MIEFLDAFATEKNVEIRFIILKDVYRLVLKKDTKMLSQDITKNYYKYKVLNKQDYIRALCNHLYRELIDIKKEKEN